MKNLIKFSTILITASILFSSCESNLAITKRHYNKGFYIDYTKNSSKEITPKSSGNIAQAPATTTINNLQSAPKQNNVQVNPIQRIAEKSRAALVSMKKMLPKISLKPVTKQNLTNRTDVTEGSSLENTSTINNSLRMNDSITDDGDHGERRALSLLWLVIVVILILWLIGLLAGGFGLGGFINLLLLIALILLILWLLRIL